MKRGLGLLLAVGILFFSGYCYGSGFFVYHQDTKAQGQAGAFTAQADNPSAIYYNPAGMTQLNGTQINVGTRVFRLETKYQNLAGAKENLNAKWEPVPNIYLTSDFNSEKWAAGLGVYTPYGLSTSWSGKGLLRYIATDTSFKMVNVNPSVAYKILPELSLGAGVNYYNVYSYTGEMKQNFFVADGDVKLDVDGDGWGFNAGLLWQPHAQHSFGLAYRSKVKVDLGGSLKYSNIPAGLGLPGSISYDVSQEMTLPGIASGGYAFRPIEELKIELDVYWVEWSTISKNKLKDSSTGQYLSVKNADWTDCWIIALGGEYLVNDKLALRAGYSYQENAVPNSTYEPSVPDANLHIVAIGLGYAWERVSLDVAYALGLYAKRDVNNSVGTDIGTTVNGKYDSVVHILGASLGYKF